MFIGDVSGKEADMTGVLKLPDTAGASYELGEGRGVLRQTGSGRERSLEGREDTPVPRIGGEDTPVPRTGGEDTPVPRTGGEDTPLPRIGREDTPVPTTGGEDPSVPPTLLQLGAVMSRSSTEEEPGIMIPEGEGRIRGEELAVLVTMVNLDSVGLYFFTSTLHFLVEIKPAGFLFSFPTFLTLSLCGLHRSPELLVPLMLDSSSLLLFFIRLPDLSLVGSREWGIEGVPCVAQYLGPGIVNSVSLL